MAQRAAATQSSVCPGVKAVKPVPLFFVRHPWPFPSALSLLGCLAQINVLEPQDVAAAFTPSQAYLQSLVSSLHTEGRLKIKKRFVEKTLRLRPSELTLAFDSCAWWPRALQPLFSTFSAPPRFCPECLKQGYHSHLFDLPWLLRCPVHAVELCDSCRHCGGKLRGLSHPYDPMEAFTCTRCRRVLAESDAIVMATHASSDRWNEVVASHFRWCRKMSDAYAVPPTCPGGEVEPDRSTLMSLIDVTGVGWPKELAPYVASSQARLPGLSRSAVISSQTEIDQLCKLFKRAVDAPLGEFKYFPCSLEQSRWLVKLERRLQDKSDQTESRAVRDHYHYYRRWRKLQGLTPQEKKALTHPSFHIDYHKSSPPPASVRARGYRSRAVTVFVGTSLVGDTSLSVAKGRLSGLTCVRLLAVVNQMRRSLEYQDEGAVGGVVAWWYEHLLSLSLIQTTTTAIHESARLSPKECPETEVVPGWPLVDMNRPPPGQSWMLAAIAANTQLTAYLIPVPMRRYEKEESKLYRCIWDTSARTAEAAAWLLRRKQGEAAE